MIFNYALKAEAYFKMSIMEKLNTAKQHSELSCYLASDYDDIKREVRTGVGCFTSSDTSLHSEPSHGLPQLQHGWMVGDCPDKRPTLQWLLCKCHWVKRTVLSCSSLPELGWTAQTLPLQTSVELLVWLDSSRNCCGDDKPWQKYLWVCSCLKPKELFSNHLVVLFNNVSRRVSYPSNSLKLAGAFFAKRNF